jgi:hypothetical protein
MGTDEASSNSERILYIVYPIPICLEYIPVGAVKAKKFSVHSPEYTVLCIK